MDNSGLMRYATYARYSSDLQRQSSIEDQMRKCHEYGTRIRDGYQQATALSLTRLSQASAQTGQDYSGC
jgi:hypothetical protein